MRKITVLLLFIALTATAQSPYFRLGYGHLFPSTDPLGSSAGQGIVALQDSGRVTLHNPAALNGLKRVSFGVVLGSTSRSIDNVVSNVTRLEQLFVSFPVGAKFGMSLGVRAIADFASEYQSSITDGIFSEKSSGGIWDYQLGLGYNYSSQLKFGIKLHTFQGLLRREAEAAVSDATELYVVKGNISGKSFELGSIANVGEKVSLGISIEIPYETPVLLGQDSLGGTGSYNDIEEDLSGWPTSINFGVVYRQNRYTRYICGISQQLVSADGFSDARVFALPEGWSTVPIASFQLGIQKLPLDRTSRSVWKRTGWQTGVSVKNFYLVPENDKLIYEYSVRTGLNVLMRDGRSLFDLSGEFGSRGGDENLPKELFTRLKFGIQINDVWFKKVKRR